MTSPRHLWSGDWEHDSTAARDELEQRRAQTDEPVAIPPKAPSPRARPSTAARILAALRQQAAAGRARWGWDLQISVLIALAIVLTAAAAYGITAIVVDSSSGQGSAVAANRAHEWLGIDVVGSPSGIMVTKVAPGSPAARAGLQPGDLVNQINNRPVGTVDGVSAALGGLQPGDTIPIQFSRGLISFTATATLATRRSGGP
jgi:hypothetical protein